MFSFKEETLNLNDSSSHVKLICEPVLSKIASIFSFEKFLLPFSKILTIISHANSSFFETKLLPPFITPDIYVIGKSIFL